jgi:hypothetical protein
VRIAGVVSAVTLAIATTVATATVMTVAPAWGNPDLICHGTGSATNPFVLIDVPTNSAHFTKHLPEGRDVAPVFINGVPNCPDATGALAPATVVPSGPFDDLDTTGFANANGGNAGSVRGGEGGRGGSGTLPICNQSTNDEDWWEAPVVDCAAGGIGGDGGDAGIAEAGDGGLAFTVGFF